MPDPRQIDQAFQRIMRSLVDTGRALHYAELARALGLAAEDGRALLRDVMQAYPIGWLHPETDYIASFPPLNNLPTQYRITVRGRAALVRAVRVRGHVRDVALPGRDRARGRAVPRLRASRSRWRCATGASPGWIRPASSGISPSGSGRRAGDRTTSEPA